MGNNATEDMVVNGEITKHRIDTLYDRFEADREVVGESP